MNFAERTLFLLVILLAPTIPAFSTTLLTGVVTDSDGAVIPNAYIIVHWDSSGSYDRRIENIGVKDDRVLHADQTGAFALELPPGFYDVFVGSEGFTPTCCKIRLKHETKVTYSPKLKVDRTICREIPCTIRLDGN
jgi:hypothetical protein